VLIEAKILKKIARTGFWGGRRDHNSLLHWFVSGRVIVTKA